MNEKPKTLYECLNLLNDNYETGDWEEFRKMEEDDAITSCHHGTGRNMRNSWELWDDTKPLVQWFSRLGINHADDMSSIILVSFHRQVNGKPIDLDAQVKVYIDYWKDSKNNAKKMLVKKRYKI